ncbi:ubiquitin carboxyl-terminal hydrolase 15-like isoform X2 [Saccostrea echinata]|uniref:ubiquitin carboxyl-terminal hydrolase 15-like isoform X2 n=1 Tax=Saccostrea echinata TaxID=191078 RepID=UPI002A8003E3|nr:ubiquitin carboxyl-terminal hydrolase 15-like isoform X2 [Saccostrea echinata]
MAEGGTSESESMQHNLEAEKDEISGLLKRELKHGDIWYLIDAKWFKQWKKYVGFDQWDMSNVGEQDAYPGPVDNSPLIREDTQELKDHLIDELDYILLPKEGWEKIIQWYGLTQGQVPVARKVIEQGMFVKHCKVEVYLMDLKLCENSNIADSYSMSFSRCDTVGDVEKVIKKKFNISENKEVRLWNKYMSNTYEHLNKEEQTLQEAGLYAGQVIVIEQKNDDGSWPRQTKRTETDSSHNKTSFNSYSINEQDSGRGTVAPGLCGLANLGNTCFMNSAIQCMSNVPKLTNYLLGDRWKDEINEENPLGMGGEIARSYADLIKTMWSGKYSYTVPRNFKIQVGKFAPQFSGYQQQDSQELLAFLLDGLHEDLNRIKKKPYIECQDTDSRSDEEAAIESWNNYKKRNDSVIVDTFHGLLKSTVHCPECSKISVTFDPFCYLSLPMPIKKERVLEVFWIPLMPDRKPIQLKVLVPKMAIISDLCAAVGEMMSSDPCKMVVTDVYNHRFHKIFSPGDALSHILDRDDIFIYEVPVSPTDSSDTMLVPVYMRENRCKNNCSSNYQTPSWQLFGQPLFLALPSRTCTAEDLYNGFLQRVSRYVQIPSKDELWNADDFKDLEKDERRTDDKSDNEEESEKNENGEMEVSTSISCPLSSSTDLNSECSSVSTKEMGNNGQFNNQSERLVKFTMVNSYGSAELDYKIKDDGNPLKISGRSYIAADWESVAKKKFYLEKKAEEFEQHISMTMRSQKKQVIQLDNCLDLFTKVEQLGENDLWYCPQCKKHQPATKKFDLWNLPEILIVHLKRFSYNRFYRDKIDALVEFPVRGLNLRKYIINPYHGPVTYDLIAVSNHYGGLGGGHYTAYAENKDDGEWYYFDDSSVSSSSEDDVVSKAAYVLVYQRQTLAQSSDEHLVKNEAMETEYTC